jgi:hypothetical protein
MSYYFFTALSWLIAYGISRPIDSFARKYGMNNPFQTTGGADRGALPARAAFVSTRGVKNRRPPLQQTGAVIDQRV